VRPRRVCPETLAAPAPNHITPVTDRDRANTKASKPANATSPDAIYTAAPLSPDLADVEPPASQRDPAANLRTQL